MVVHLNEKVECAGHMMSMPYCGLDDSESAMYTDYITGVTCKRCIRKHDAKIKKITDDAECVKPEQNRKWIDNSKGKPELESNEAENKNG